MGTSPGFGTPRGVRWMKGCLRESRGPSLLPRQLVDQVALEVVLVVLIRVVRLGIDLLARLPGPVHRGLLEKVLLGLVEGTGWHLLPPQSLRSFSRWRMRNVSISRVSRVRPKSRQRGFEQGPTKTAPLDKSRRTT